jgi:hypothetical protein
MTTIEAIETSYAGYRFRSRLEARWAVFFDSLGMKYKYEPQGYLLDGKPYLPDFLIHPDTPYATWFEVKGKFPTSDEIDKARMLAEGTGIRTYLYFGGVEVPAPGLAERITTFQAFFEPWMDVPVWLNEHGWSYRAGDAFEWEVGLRPTAFRFDPGSSIGAEKSRREPKSNFWWWADCPICGRVVLKLHGDTDWCPTIPDRPGPGLPEGVSMNPRLVHETPRLVAAYAAARSARFEHGETPKVPAARSGDPA